MYPTSLRVKNFGSFKEAEYQFQDGLTLVTGENNDVEGSSNGSGKSMFFVDALTWLLYGTTCRGMMHGNIVRYGEKEAEVEGNFIINNKKINLIRKRFGTTTTIHLDGVPVALDTFGHIAGMQYDAFSSSVLYPQSQPGFIERTDSSRKDILTSILDLYRWDKYGATTRRKLDKYIERKDKLAWEIANINSTRQEKTIESLTKDNELFGKNKSRDIKMYQQHQQELIIKIKRQTLILNDYIKECKKLKDEEQILITNSLLNAPESVIQMKSDAYSTMNMDIKLRKATYRSIVTYSDELNAVQKGIKLAEGTLCPICNIDITEESRERVIQHYMDMIKKLKLDHINYSEKIINKKKRYMEYSDMATQSTNLQSHLQKLNSSITGIEYDILVNKDTIMRLEKEFEECKESIARKKGELNPYKKYLSEFKKQEEGRKIKLDHMETELQELKQELDYLYFWKTGFGDKGIKSLILDSIVEEFQERTNYYLQSLSMQNMLVTVDTQRQTKTGVAETFTINVVDDIGGRIFNAWSGGEQKRINIATQLALADIVRRRSSTMWDFIVFDECMDGLDDEGKEMMLSLLNELVKERRMVYVISHDFTIKDMIEQEVTVTKRKGISYLA